MAWAMPKQTEKMARVHSSASLQKREAKFEATVIDADEHGGGEKTHRGQHLGEVVRRESAARSDADPRKGQEENQALELCSSIRPEQPSRLAAERSRSAREERRHHEDE